MTWHVWNKLFVVSLAFAVAGTLACVAALLDMLVPHASALSFLCWSAAVVVAVVLLVNGYVWACDRCEEYLSQGTDRRLGHGWNANPTAIGSRRIQSATDREAAYSLSH